MRATVVGGSGYIGGELVRLLLGHPEIELTYVTSTKYADRPLRTAHPNLRGRTNLTFTPDSEVGESDVVFLAMPHGAAMKEVDRWASLAPRVVDLSADHRIQSTDLRERYYPGGVPDPEWLARFRTGIPELNRRAHRVVRRRPGARRGQPPPGAQRCAADGEAARAPAHGGDHPGV